MFPLGLLTPGEKAQIALMRTSNHNRHDKNHSNFSHDKEQSRAENMGLRVGQEVEMLNNEGQGPVLVKIEESRIAVSRQLARKIMVKK